MKTRKAGGPDEIGSDFIKHLTERGKRQALEIFNYSWKEKWIPKQWRTATIIPIRKKGKPQDKVQSFRPIALFSHLGKLMERLETARLVWWLERYNKISQKLAGFRKSRATVDQCLRISQKISDGFQRKPPQRTVIVLFDYSGSFNTVWRGALFEKLMDMRIPKCMLLWLRGWMVNRLARVKVGESLSRVKAFVWGLPQKGGLSLTLFIIFINDLETFEPTTEVSTFADDLALATVQKDKQEALRMMQEEANKVVEWSGRWRLKLNVSKRETCLFTTDSSEAIMETKSKDRRY